MRQEERKIAVQKLSVEEQNKLREEEE